MPWGIQRLNAKRSQPNANIVFIKPLAGPSAKTAQDFLERIAAQCVPIMRRHHLYIMSLEEFEPNREFVGRNFNAGEVIQLVLKSPQTGRWLPFEYVQMVMMHELAHCKQMNHSRAFWAVRNVYASDMHALWRDGYTGEGVWGRGARLASGEFEKNVVRADEVLPEHLCGGTYRSKGRKRRSKPTLTYQQRKERRILKKFGKNGVKLDADNEVKTKLEKGKRVQARPRVANSARGRELRAAAALARFEQHKEEESAMKDEEKETGGEEEEVSESASDSDYELDDAPDLHLQDAVDVDGRRMRDSKGRGMVKVCEDEDTEDPHAKDELDQLRASFSGKLYQQPCRSGRRCGAGGTSKGYVGRSQEQQDGEFGDSRIAAIKRESVDDAAERSDAPLGENASRRPVESAPRETRSCSALPLPATANRVVDPETCQVSKACSLCSFANAEDALTCGMCANVLDPAGALNGWRCRRSTCVRSSYVNSDDCRLCGLCGEGRGEGS